MTLLLLWEEYRTEHADGYGYSRFCDLYRAWRGTISPTMRQTHGPAEKLFVDFAGDTVPAFDAATATERRAHVFVAVLGASNYTYTEARWSEGLADWIAAHVNTFSTIGGVPNAIVCDNLKAGVTVTSRYEPGINRTYQEIRRVDARPDAATIRSSPRSCRRSRIPSRAFAPVSASCGSPAAMARPASKQLAGAAPRRQPARRYFR